MSTPLDPVFQYTVPEEMIAIGAIVIIAGSTASLLLTTAFCIRAPSRILRNWMAVALFTYAFVFLTREFWMVHVGLWARAFSWIFLAGATLAIAIWNFRHAVGPNRDRCP